MTTLPQTAPMRYPRAVIPSQPSGPAPLAAGPGAAGAPGAAPAGLTAADAWRVIRANLWLIIVMVLASAVIGYVVNQYLARNYSRYTAVGLVEVHVPSEIPMPGVPNDSGSPEQIALAQTTQKNQLTHESLFLLAIQDDECKIRTTKWFQQYKDRIDQAKKDLDDNFVVEPIAGSRLLRIAMTGVDPEEARIIEKELIEKHIDKLKGAQRGVEESKVTQLKKERVQVENVLNEEVMRQLREKEAQLGLDQVGTSLSWSGKQFQLDRLLQEQARIRTELAGYESRYKTVVSDLGEGKTPAEVEASINNTVRYVTAQQRLDDLDIELEQLERKLGPQHDWVIQWKARRVAYQGKRDEVREELKSTFSETMKSMLFNEITASQANNGRVEDLIVTVSKQLGELNKTMNEYRQLQDRQQELRKKQTFLTDEINNINQFRLETPWAPAAWAAEPQKPDRPSFPILWKTMSVAVMVGLALSLGIAFLRELTDNTVRSTRDVERCGQLNLLGVVQHEADDPQAAGGRLPLAIFDAPHSMVAEQFRQVRTRLQHSAALDSTRTILVTSPGAGDGKSTVACNLAAALALNGRRVLLVDANFRKPQVHAVFGADNGAGFGDALANVEQTAQFVRETEVPNLFVLPAGTRPPNATELLESQLFHDFVEQALADGYEHVVFDGGPMLMVSEATALAPRVDGVVTVVRARGNSRGLLMRMRDELRKLKAEHLGVVLNAVRSQGGGYYGGNIKRYYAYQNQ